MAGFKTMFGYNGSMGVERHVEYANHDFFRQAVKSVKDNVRKGLDAGVPLSFVCEEADCQVDFYGRKEADGSVSVPIYVNGDLVFDQGIDPYGQPYVRAGVNADSPGSALAQTSLWRRSSPNEPHICEGIYHDAPSALPRNASSLRNYYPNMSRQDVKHDVLMLMDDAKKSVSFMKVSDEGSALEMTDMNPAYDRINLSPGAYSALCSCVTFGANSRNIVDSRRPAVIHAAPHLLDNGNGIQCWGVDLCDAEKVPDKRAKEIFDHYNGLFAGKNTIAANIGKAAENMAGRMSGNESNKHPGSAPKPNEEREFC